MKVIVKRPDDPKGYLADIPNTLEALQDIVGGYIEPKSIFTDITIICNEEGRIRGLPYNMNFIGIDFVGTIIFAGRNEDELTDLPEDFVQLWEEGRAWK